MRRITLSIIANLLLSSGLSAQEALPAKPNVPQATAPLAASEDETLASYILGPGDEITVWVLGLEEFATKSFRVDTSGYLDLPLLGRFQAKGHTVEQLKSELTDHLKNEVKEPRVAVSIAEFRSQPVSIVGAVKTPGVHQLQGRKTLLEILSQGGGLQPEAGNSIKITRRLEYGRIPLASAKDDPSGQFSVAELDLKSIMEAKNPEENIDIRPHDVITVPRASLVYVIGAVHKPGGFVLQERETLSVLQALSMAEGLGPAPSSKNSVILRPVPGETERLQIPVDLNQILAGKAPDVALQAEDILFIPSSTAKKVTGRLAEAAIQAATGVVIWGRY